MAYISGQRYINSADLQLGLGRVVAENTRMVKIAFDAIEEERIYAKDSAPLTRYVLEINDMVQHKDGWQMVVEEVKQLNGLNIYIGRTQTGEEQILPETEIANTISLDKPAERILNVQLDSHRWYQLRQLARYHQLRLGRSEMFGLTGCRTALLAHQLYIAYSVSKRHAPRVLLADEVGLGKTIEAGLIIHKQLLVGHVQRVLIVVPDALVHQWLVELLRRFNLSISVFDEEKCTEAEQSSNDNPFDTAQLVLLPLSLLLQQKHRQQQVLDAGWDMLVVDEAHHLHWDESGGSEEYALIEQLAGCIPGVLLLTATPEQLGKESHFARLRLLDPDKYHDFNIFKQEEKEFERLADWIDDLMKGEFESKNLINKNCFLDQYAREILMKASNEKNSQERSLLKTQLVNHLLDQYGTGRIFYRNTRASVEGFPKRSLKIYPFKAPEEYQSCISELNVELNPEVSYQHVCSEHAEQWLAIDPRVNWLVDQIKQDSKPKLLVIASQQKTVLQLEGWLREKFGIHAAVFHEDMSLIERDQSAAWFADMEQGAQVLLCSEIGSEGRNFQFAHHLLLFDLPSHPDILEQRIGRLDRIGQKNTIQIHVPYLIDTAQQRWFEWYHAGLAIFEKTNPAASVLYEAFIDRLKGSESIESIVRKTQKESRDLLHQLQNGRDRLLEYNSCRPQQAEEIMQQAEDLVTALELESFLHEAYDLFGIDFEEHRAGSEIIRPTDEMHGYFPFVLQEGMTITYDREVALANENMHFITWEHPMVTELLDLIASEEKGNTALVALKDSGLSPGQLMVELRYHVQPVNVDGLQLSRYLPALDQRFVMTENGQNIAGKLTEDLVQRFACNVPKKIAIQVLKAKIKEVKMAIKKAESDMQKILPDIIQKGQKAITDVYQKEIDRLKQLAEKNTSVRDIEIEHMQKNKVKSNAALSKTQPNLDSIRIIVTM